MLSGLQSESNHKIACPRSAGVPSLEGRKRLLPTPELQINAAKEFDLPSAKVRMKAFGDGEPSERSKSMFDLISGIAVTISAFGFTIWLVLWSRRIVERVYRKQLKTLREISQDIKNGR